MNQLARMSTIVLWIVAVAALASLAFRMRPDPTLTTMVPQSDHELMQQVAFFDERSASQLLFLEARSSDLELSLNTLRNAARSLEPHGATPIAPPSRSDDIAAAQAAQIDSATELDRAVAEHLPVLVPPHTLQTLDQRITVAAIRDRLEIIAQRLAEPGGVFMSSRLKRDLLGLEDDVLAVIGTGFVGQPQSMTPDGILCHADGHHVAMVFQVDFAPGDADRSGQLMAAVRDLQDEASQQQVFIDSVGAYRHFDDNYRLVSRDLMVTLPLSLAVIFLLLWSLYRKKRDILAVHMPGIAGTVTAAAAAVVLFGQKLPLPVLGFGAAMLGIAVDYGIHMTRAVRDGRSEQVVRPLLLSFITAASAFAVLITSDVSALRILGVYVVCGLGAALLTALIVLPRILRRRQQRDPWRRMAEPLVLSGHRHRWLWAIAGVVLTAAAVPGLLRLTVVDNPHQLDGSAPETMQTLHAFRERWGGLGGNSFLVGTGPDLPVAIKHILTTREQLGLPLGPPELLMPPAETQSKRLALWQATWAQQLETLRANLQIACRELGMRASAFESSLQSYARSTCLPIDSTTWDGTPVASSLAEYIHHNPDSIQVISPIVDGQLSDELIRSHQNTDEATGAWIASRDRLGARLVEAMLDELLVRGGIIAVVMIIALGLIVRRPITIAAILVPPAAALIWTYGIFGWLGIQLNALHILVGAFVAGIGIDDAIFLSRTDLRNHSMSPILATTATTTAGVGVLSIAGHPALNQVGIAVAIGMGCCLLACLCLCPAFDLPARSTVKTLKPEEVEAAIKRREKSK